MNDITLATTNEDPEEAEAMALFLTLRANARRSIATVLATEDAPDELALAIAEAESLADEMLADKVRAAA